MGSISANRDSILIVLSILLISSLVYVSMVPMGAEKEFQEGIDRLEKGGEHLEKGFTVLGRGSYGQAATEFGDASNDFAAAEEIFKELSEGDGDIAESAKKAENYAFLAKAGTRSISMGCAKLSRGEEGGQELIDQGVETLVTADTYLKQAKGLKDVPEIETRP